MLEAREPALFLPLLALCKVSLSPSESCLPQPNVEAQMDLKPSTGDYRFLRSACASLCSSMAFLEDLGTGVDCISTCSAAAALPWSPQFEESKGSTFSQCNPGLMP